MKFQCDRCKTRYSIADEKVRGKVLKIRCKSCEAVITLRDGVATEAGEPAAGKRAARAASHTIELGAAAPPDDVTDPRARLPEAPEEWYLSVNGVQEGPLSAEQAQKRVAGRAPGISIHAWRDDFSEWLAVENVPVLAVHLPRSVSAPHAGASPRPTPAVPLPVPVGPSFGPAGTPPPPSDGFDFNIGEASRLVQLPILPPPVSAPPRASSGGLPGMSLPVAPPPADAIDPAARADESLKLNIGSPSSAPRRVSFEMSVGAGRPRRRIVPVLVVGGCVSGLLAVGAIFALRGGDDRAPALRETPRDSVLVSEFYKKDNQLFAHAADKPAEPAAAETPPAPPVVEIEEPPEKPAATNGGRPKPRIVDPPRSGVRIDPIGRPEPARIGRTGPTKEDTFGATDGDALTPDDVRSMYSANEINLKRCYERALKSDPTSNITKMVVKISIQPDGRVTDIKVPDRGGELAECVTNSVRAWRFRRSSGEFTTEFTVVFARKN